MPNLPAAKEEDQPGPNRTEGKEELRRHWHHQERGIKADKRQLHPERKLDVDCQGKGYNADAQ